MATSSVGVDPTAVVGRRLVAATVDGLLGVAVAVGTFVVVHERVDALGLARCTDAPQPSICLSSGATGYVATGGRAWLVLGLWAAWAVAVHVVLRGVTGRTPGTAAHGLACVDEQGRPPGIGRAATRSAAGLVDYVPCCLPLVGVVTIATTPGHRRVGDLAASTYVIDRVHAGHQVRVDRPPGTSGREATRSAGAPPVAPGTPPAPWGSAPPRWDARRHAYVRWDQASGRWLRFDQATNRWLPVDEA